MPPRLRLCEDFLELLLPKEGTFFDMVRFDTGLLIAVDMAVVTGFEPFSRAF